MANGMSSKLDAKGTAILATISSVVGFILALTWSGAFGYTVNLYWWSLALEDEGASNLWRVLEASYLCLILTYLLTRRLKQAKSQPTGRPRLFWSLLGISLLFLSLDAMFEITPPDPLIRQCIPLSVVFYVLCLGSCWVPENRDIYSERRNSVSGQANGLPAP